MSKDVVTSDSLRAAFGQALVELAETKQFYVTDCDVAGGTCTNLFRDKYPQRFVQCGISEQAAACLSAGLTMASGKPVFFTTFAAFMMRAFEQIVLSICYNKANVKLFASHPGVQVGPDGASAQCLWDLAAFLAVPGLPVIVPADPQEMKQVTAFALDYDGPMYVRTGRSSVENITIPHPPFVLGKPVELKQGNDCIIFACGPQVGHSLKATEQLWDRDRLSVGVTNVSTLYPLDDKVLFDIIGTTDRIVIAEDASPNGGLYDAVCGSLAARGITVKAAHACVNGFGQSGESDELKHFYGIDADGIANKVREVMK